MPLFLFQEIEQQGQSKVFDCSWLCWLSHCRDLVFVTEPDGNLETSQTKQTLHQIYNFLLIHMYMPSQKAFTNKKKRKRILPSISVTKQLEVLETNSWLWWDIQLLQESPGDTSASQSPAKTVVHSFGMLSEMQIKSTQYMKHRHRIKKLYGASQKTWETTTQNAIKRSSINQIESLI